MAPAMPCKRMNRQHSGIVKAIAEPKICNEKEFKTVYGCTVESHESTRQRPESLQFKTHEDRIAEKGFTSMTHYYNLVHKFIPMPQAMKIQDAKVAVDKGWKKSSRQFRPGTWEKSRAKRMSSWRRKETMKVHFASLMDICHLKKAELEPKLQRYKGRVVLW